jgi:hypothetical protein
MPDSDPQSSKPTIFLTSNDIEVEWVFPIRNLVGNTEPPNQDLGKSVLSRSSDDEASTRKAAGGVPALDEIDPHVRASTTKHQVSAAAKIPTFIPPPNPPISPEETLRRLSPIRTNDALSGQSGGEKSHRISERALLVPAKDGPPGAILYAADDGKPSFYRCEDEPIHTPGAVQQYGVLVALKFNEKGDLQVRIASENSSKLLQYSPAQLFALDSFFDLLETEVCEDITARITNALSPTGEDVEETHLDVFQMAITSPQGVQIPLWCAIHISKGTKDLVICEFEDYSNPFQLGPVQSINSLPEAPIHTLDNELLPDELLKSTTSGSTPLRVLRTARRRKQKIVSSMDIFNAMTQSQEQLAAATSVQSVLDIVVGLISELTKFHRVMFYRFDSQNNGCIDAELVNPRASDDLFRGKSRTNITISDC